MARSGTDTSTSNKQGEPSNSMANTPYAEMKARHDAEDQERWAKLPPIVKNLYIEDPEVSRMSPSQVAEWRRANSDMQVMKAFPDQPDLKPVPNPVFTFEQAFENYPEILDKLYEYGFQKPTPIQSQAWPILLGGEDLIGIAPTGTGKTLAYLLPALIHIKGQANKKTGRQGPSVLIIVPTRELAIQVNIEVSKYRYEDMKSICLHCGKRGTKIKSINEVDIVVATAGFLKKYHSKMNPYTINYTYIVIDEADKLLNGQYSKMLSVALSDTRPDHQTVMVSATWQSQSLFFGEKFNKDPIQIYVGSLDLAAVQTVTQQFLFVDDDDKEKILLNFIGNMDKTDNLIVFCNNKASAIHVSTHLAVKGICGAALYAGAHNSDRKLAFKEYWNGCTNIIVATDIASRGIDKKDLDFVINFDFPLNIADYIYRIGRTGRMDKCGTAITYMTKYDGKHAEELIMILIEANQEVPDELRHGFFVHDQRFYPRSGYESDTVD